MGALADAFELWLGQGQGFAGLGVDIHSTRIAPTGPLAQRTKKRQISRPSGLLK
jgi:hypothetical protein